MSSIAEDAGQGAQTDPAARQDTRRHVRAKSHWPNAAVGIAVVSAPDCPPQVMMQAAVDRPTIQLALARNPYATPEALLEALDDLEDRRPRRGWLAWETLRALARNPRLPIGALRRLNLAHGPDIGASVGANPAAPPDLLDAVIDRHGIPGTAGVAANPALDPTWLARLSRHSAPTVRLAAAGNPLLADEDLVRLAGDPSSLVRRTVDARLAGQPWEVTRTVLLINGEGTRGRVIANLTGAQEKRLAADEDRRVRAALARHTTRAETLTVLASDPDPLVRRRATRRLLAVLSPALRPPRRP